MKLTDFFINVNFTGDLVKLKKFDTGLQSMGKNLAKLSATFTGVNIALDKFFQSTSKQVIDLINFEKQTGLSIEKLQQWQQVASLSNLNMKEDEVLSSILTIQKKLTGINAGLVSGEGFSMAGISTDTDAFGVMEQLKNQIKSLNNTQAVNLIERIGLSGEFINVLRLSNKEFERLGKGDFLSGKQKQDIIQTAQGLRQVKIQLKQFKDIGVSNLSSELDKIIKNFFEWMKKNGNIIIETIKDITKGMISFIDAFGNSFGFVKNLVDGIFGVENGLKVLIATMGYLIIASTPLRHIFSSWTIPLMLALSIFDDIKVSLEGGKSIIGKFFSTEQIAGFVEKLKQVLLAFKKIGFFVIEVFKIVFNVLKPVLSVLSKVAGFVAGFASDIVVVGGNIAEKSTNDLKSGNYNVSTVSSNYRDNLANLGKLFKDRLENSGLPNPVNIIRDSKQPNNTNNNDFTINVQSNSANPQVVADLIPSAIANAQANNRINSY